MMARDWLFLFMLAFGAALVWTWMITWAIRTYGNYQEEKKEP